MFIAVDNSVLKHRHINLLLEGLDTVANVTLNNVLLLSADNMFQRYVIDITDIIKVHFTLSFTLVAEIYLSSFVQQLTYEWNRYLSLIHI